MPRDKENLKRWTVKNKKKILAKHMRWYYRNKERENERCRRYYQKNQKKDNTERCRIYRDTHPEKIRELKRRDRINNPESVILRSAVKQMIVSAGLSKKYHSWQYVGCSPGFLRSHLESLFQPGMDWGNYGKWTVDHIVPLSWWPFKKDPLLLFVASHWTNLKPMWAGDNFSKKNRYSEAVA